MSKDIIGEYYVKITAKLLKQSIIANLSRASVGNLHTEATSSGLRENIKLHKNVYLLKMASLKYDVVDRGVRAVGGVMQGGKAPMGEMGERGTILTKLKICVPPNVVCGRWDWAPCGGGGGVALLEIQ